MDSVGLRIKQLREANSLTQSEFSSLLGTTRSMIASIETGHREPKELLIRSIAQHFSVREKWLRFGELPIRENLAEAVEQTIVQNYFALSAELAPSFPSPDALTRLLSKSQEFAQIFHYISATVMDHPEKNEPKRLSALFEIVFPDFPEKAVEVLKRISDKEKTAIRKPIIARNRSIPSTNLPNVYSYSLPVLGAAAAGAPIFDSQDGEERVVVPSKYSDPDRFLAVRARGDSMEPKISSGDIVIAQRGLVPQAGQAALVCLAGMADDEYTIKRFYPEHDRMVLRSYNDAYQDMIYAPDDLRSCDAVVHVIPAADA